MFLIFSGVQLTVFYSGHFISWFQYIKASVTILADFCPEFNPPFCWRCKHQTKITVHINNLVSSEFPNRSNRSTRSFISTLNCTLKKRGVIIIKIKHFNTKFEYLLKTMSYKIISFLVDYIVEKWHFCPQISKIRQYIEVILSETNDG